MRPVTRAVVVAIAGMMLWKEVVVNSIRDFHSINIR
jgi:hypothetical protein